MKLITVFLLFVLLLLLWCGRDYAWTSTPPAYRRLPTGQSSPLLLKVGNRWPLRDGTDLYFRKGESRYGTVLQTDADRVLVALSTGGKTWLRRNQIKGSFVIQPRGAASSDRKPRL